MLNYKFNKNEFSDTEYINYSNDKYKHNTFIDINKNLLNEFLTLKKEIEEAQEFINLNIKVENNSNCDHQLLLEDNDCYFGYCSYICPICNKKLKKIKDKNKYFIFPGSYYDEDYGQIDRFNINIIQNIIINYLKNKNDNDEIYLNKEFRKIKINGYDINDPRNIYKNRILIIGGKNNIEIDNNRIIKSNNTIPVESFFNLLHDKIPDTYIKILELDEYNDELITHLGYFIDHIKCKSINELEKLIELEKNKTYNIIIDITNFIDYEIINSNIKIKKKSLNLEEIFKENNIFSLSFDNNNYQYIENNEIKTIEKEKILKKIKEATT